MKQEIKLCEDCLFDVSLKGYNTFHIGGVVRCLASPKNLEELKTLIVQLRKERIPYFLLGNGSNVILSDDYYDGVVIRLNHFSDIVFSSTEVYVSAGVMMPKFAMETVHKGYTGFEWAVGIPGTVGGCIYGNAEAYKESTFDSLVSVDVLTPDLEFQTILKEDLTYAYRTSVFKEQKGYIILGARFSIKPGNLDESLAIIQKRMKKRRDTQPLEYPSAGSVFRNPSPENPSGRLIEMSGLKGVRVGGAEVSQKHANFIINTGNATSQDVRNLIELVHHTVNQKYEIDLILEQEYVGWDFHETEGK